VSSRRPGCRTSAPSLSRVAPSSSSRRSAGERSAPRSKRAPASAAAIVACSRNEVGSVHAPGLAKQSEPQAGAAAAPASRQPASANFAESVVGATWCQSALAPLSASPPPPPPPQKHPPHTFTNSSCSPGGSRLATTICCASGTTASSRA
jgi:hypothetical protein